MYRSVVVIARSAAAILEIKLNVGCPEGILDNFVKMDVAAVFNKGCFFIDGLAHPGNLLVVSVDDSRGYGLDFPACGGPVYHDGELIASVAFVELGLEIEIMTAILRYIAIFTVQLNGVFFAAVDGILEVSATLDFPTVVNVAATGQCERQGAHGKHCAKTPNIGSCQKHTLKLEIIFDLDAELACFKTL